MLNNFRWSLMDYKFKGELIGRCSRVRSLVDASAERAWCPGSVAHVLTGACRCQALPADRTTNSRAVSCRRTTAQPPQRGTHRSLCTTAGEEVLRKSGLPYTVVRPAGLTDDPAGQAQLAVAQGDKSSGRVARADVAAVAVAALTGECRTGWAVWAGMTGIRGRIAVQTSGLCRCCCCSSAVLLLCLRLLLQTLPFGM